MATALHEESIARFGGAGGPRDVGLLEAALARPKNLHAYDAIGDVPTLAAASGFAVARNHPFVDGNERAAVLLVAVFVALNGSRFDSDRVDEVATFLVLAEGTIDEPAFAAWVAAQCSRGRHRSVTIEPDRTLGALPCRARSGRRMTQES